MRLLAVICLAVALAAPGCASLRLLDLDDPEAVGELLFELEGPGPECPAPPGQNPDGPPPADPGGVVPAPPASGDFDPLTATYLHTSTAAWPETVPLEAVTIRGRRITFHSSAAPPWPWPTAPGTKDVVGNPWICAKVNGRWTCGTWEWLRRGAGFKDVEGAAAEIGRQVKAPPLKGWTPGHGELVYVGVSTPARPGARPTVNEKTNWVEVIWP